MLTEDFKIPVIPVVVNRTGNKLNHAQLVHLNRKINFGSEPNSCWLWTGCLRNSNYGVVGFCFGSKETQKTFQVHRIIYSITKKLLLEDIPVLHHKCNNKHCSNPDHLDLMTINNHARLVNASRVMCLKPTCKKGHVFTASSWGYTGRNRRYCLPCKNEREKKNKYLRLTRKKEFTNLSK